jgi:hypothetical protein
MRSTTISRVARVVLPLIAISASAALSAIFSVVVYFFCTLQIDNVATTTFAGIVIFLIGWVLVFGISLYCAAVYDKLHRMFLLIIIVTGGLSLGILAYSILTLADALFSCVHALWRENSEVLIRNLEELFECTGFQVTPPDPGEPTTCADTIRGYIDAKTRELGRAFGICAIVYCVIAVGCVYLACKIKDELPGELGAGEKQDLSTFHDPVAPAEDALAAATGTESL